MNTMPEELTLDDFEDYLPNGYNISDLPRDKQVIVDLALMLYEGITIPDCAQPESFENPTTFEKIKMEYAEKIIDEVKRSFVMDLADTVVTMIEESE